MENKEKEKLSEESLIEDFQAGRITLAEYFQRLPETRDDYLLFCSQEGRHPSDNEAAKAFSREREEAFNGGMLEE